jgi:hypothetical protein
MAGKPKTKPSPGWGGARAGGGRKPINQLSDAESKKLFREIKKRTKIEGRNWQAVLLDFVFGKDLVTGIGLDLTGKERLTALRLIADLAVAKQSEQTVNVNRTDGPSIGLPPARQDPAKLVALEGKKAANE